MFMTKAEKRGDLKLSKPAKVRTYKTPVLVYLHYQSRGGELLACAIVTSPQGRGNLIYGDPRGGPKRPHIVDHFYAKSLEDGARLVILPSQFVKEHAQMELAA